VHVEDVAAAFAAALTQPRASARPTSCAGRDAWSWKEILKPSPPLRQEKADAAGAGDVHRPGGGVMDRFSWFPVTRDQLTMLLAGNTCATTASPGSA
jgi:uncharacterized protein YbjT (DUF2867 family)